MDNETLLRIHDELHGVMVAYDNNNRKTVLCGTTEEAHEIIREMIKKRKEPKE